MRSRRCSTDGIRAVFATMAVPRFIKARSMSLARTLLATALMLSLGGCAATLAPRAQVIPDDQAPVAVEPAAPVAVVPVVAAGPVPNDNLNAVAWMQTSVE